MGSQEQNILLVRTKSMVGEGARGPFDKGKQTCKPGMKTHGEPCMDKRP
jgi:hypothetical protein